MKKVTVIIPSYNEEKYIARCLDSILASDCPLELIEVLVCDGMSSDRTPDIIKEYSVQNANIKYLVNEKKTAPYAVNLGIKQAMGDLILFLGAHSELSVNYIRKCAEVLDEKPDVYCVGGVLKNHSEDEKTQAIAAAMSSPFGVGSAHFRTGLKSGYADTVAFGLYRREVFEKVGLLDEELTRNQDDEFNYRLIKNGLKIWLTNKTHVVYYVRSSLPKLFRQYYQYGYWKVYVNRKHKAITTSRQLVPMFFVLYLLLFPLPVILGGRFLIAYQIGLDLYVLLIIIGALRAKVGLGRKFTVLQAFPTIHFAYGWGYLLGIIDFIFLNKAKPSEQKAKISR